MARTGFSILAELPRVFADTAYFFELLDATAPNHVRAVEIAAEIDQRRIQVATTWEIVLECATLLRYRLSFKAAKVFLTDIVPELTLLYPDDEERLAATEEFLKRGKHRRLSLCDALSLVMVSRRLNWAPCLTFDADFAAMGLTVVR